jgi:hypothetical protein
MTHITSTSFSSSAPEITAHSLLSGSSAAALRLAPAPPGAAIQLARHSRVPVTLRNPDLLADLRQARAGRFASRYEWLAVRRRRAQIAARHALDQVNVVER